MIIPESELTHHSFTIFSWDDQHWSTLINIDQLIWGSTVCARWRRPKRSAPRTTLPWMPWETFIARVPRLDGSSDLHGQKHRKVDGNWCFKARNRCDLWWFMNVDMDVWSNSSTDHQLHNLIPLRSKFKSLGPERIDLLQAISLGSNNDRS